MATIITRANGTRAVQFVDPSEVRRTVSLGDATRNEASRIALQIQHIVDCRKNGVPIDRDCETWANSLPSDLRNRFAAVGLMVGTVPGVNAFLPETLGAFFESYIEVRADLKPASQTKLLQTKNKLIAFFGENRTLRSVTAGDADSWRIQLAKTLAENSVRRHCGLAKQFFNAAIRRELIQKNPFSDLVCAVKRNTARYHFISRKDAEAVLEACPNAEWRLLFAMARFGGLRVPSEVMALRWEDIDWQRNRFTVRSPKTEHHEGKAFRVVPIFPELRPYLDAAWDEAEQRQSLPDAKPEEFVMVRHRNPAPVLRRQLERILTAAGLKRWPKLWQNLRSTRETELSESFPIHVVCEWIGNSEAVAKQHYLQVTDDHFRRALDPVRQPAESCGGNSQSPSIPEPPRAANALQTGAKLGDLDRNEGPPPDSPKPKKNPGKHGVSANFPGSDLVSNFVDEWALRDLNLPQIPREKRLWLKLVATPVATLLSECSWLDCCRCFQGWNSPHDRKSWHLLKG